MPNPLTYHGVEVPVWETSHAEEMPAGPGWARANVPTEPMDTLPCWRRPHPWRVMLEGARDDTSRGAADSFVFFPEVVRDDPIRAVLQSSWSATFECAACNGAINASGTNSTGSLGVKCPSCGVSYTVKVTEESC